MKNKILICITESTSSNGVKIIPGKKYIIDELIKSNVQNSKSNGSNEVILYKIKQGDKIIGYFNIESLKKYFQFLEDYRNNIIDKILN